VIDPLPTESVTVEVPVTDKLPEVESAKPAKSSVEFTPETDTLPVPKALEPPTMSEPDATVVPPV